MIEKSKFSSKVIPQRAYDSSVSESEDNHEQSITLKYENSNQDAKYKK